MVSPFERINKKCKITMNPGRPQWRGGYRAVLAFERPRAQSPLIATNMNIKKLSVQRIGHIGLLRMVRA
jgi:hypothetical protein